MFIMDFEPSLLKIPKKTEGFYNHLFLILISILLLLPSSILFFAKSTQVNLSFVDMTEIGLGNTGIGSHSSVFADVTGDGKPDLYITMYHSQIGDLSDLFYLNVYDSTYDDSIFIERAFDRGIDDFDGGSHGACFADLDNDGDYDLINGTTSSPKGDHNDIFVNNGIGFFTDWTSHIKDIYNSKKETRAVVAFDMDNDGDLDIFTVSGYLGSGDPPDEMNEIFRNDGNIQFTAITTGDLYTAPAGQGATDTDYDGDGDIDIIAANRSGSLNILQNDGSGNFTTISPSSIGIGDTAGDGITMGDVDNDGDLDILLVSEGPPNSACLYHNKGNGKFTLAKRWSDINGYMGGFADLDNNGNLDLVFPGYNRCFRNDEKGFFYKGPSIPVKNINDPRGIAFADIDSDGDMDFVITNKRSKSRLIRNDLISENHWLKIKLISPQGQAGAFGAKVYVYPEGQIGGPLLGFRESRSSNGYLAQDDPLLHFGLGLNSTVDVVVMFLDSSAVTYTEVQADQTITMSGIRGDRVQIVVNTNPEGLAFTINGITYTSLKTFYWYDNDTYTLSVDSLQKGEESTQYIYTSWSDGGDRNHTYTFSDSGDTITANFKLQYQLSLKSTYGTVSGTGWYDQGTSVTFSVSPTNISEDQRAQHQFTGWTGTGNGSYTGEDSSYTVTMNNPITENADWETTKYYLTISENPDEGGNAIPSPPGQWYDSESYAIVEAVPDTECGYIFSKWSGDITGTKNPSIFLVDSPKNVTANFKLKSYTLTIQVEPEGTGIIQKFPDKETYTHGDSLTLLAVPDSGFIFNHWADDIEDTNSSVSLIMNRNMNVTAHFKKNDILPPHLYACYPRVNSLAVPQNTSIQFRLKDEGYGINQTTLNIYVNGTALILNGEDQTEGLVTSILDSSNYLFNYYPVPDFEEKDTVTVWIYCEDLTSPPNTLDSTYTFTIGNSIVIQTKAEIIDQNGGTVTDDSTDIEINLPAGALNEATEITIGFINNIPPLPDSVNGIGLAYHFGPDGLQFNDSATIRIPYNQDNLDSADVTDPQDLPVYYFSTAKGTWSKLKIIDVYQDKILIKIKEFCYLVLGEIIPTRVEKNRSDIPLPTEFALLQNYPNPFNAETTFIYQLPRNCDVLISVYDPLGREVFKFMKKNKAPGYYSIHWGGMNNRGDRVPSGIYLLHMQAGQYSEIRKMILLR